MQKTTGKYIYSGSGDTNQVEKLNKDEDSKSNQYNKHKQFGQ